MKELERILSDRASWHDVDEDWLEAARRSVGGRNAGVLLRRFACRCVRLAGPESANRAPEAIECSRRWIRGEVTADDLRASSDELGNAACAAVVVGRKNDCSNAAPFLSARSTLAAEAVDAAISAARMHRLWAQISATNTGADDNRATAKVLVEQVLELDRLLHEVWRCEMNDAGCVDWETGKCPMANSAVWRQDQ